MGRRWSCRRKRGSRCAGGEEEVKRNVNVNMMMTNIGKEIERVHRKCIGIHHIGVFYPYFLSPHKSSVHTCPISPSSVVRRSMASLPFLQVSFTNP